MSANRGLFLFNILFAAVFSPTIVLLAGRLIDGILCQLVGFGVVTILVFFFPGLKDFRGDYVLAQVFGWTFGVVVFTSAVSKEVVVAIWAVLIMILFYKPSLKAYYILLGSK